MKNYCRGLVHVWLRNPGEIVMIDHVITRSCHEFLKQSHTFCVLHVGYRDAALKKWTDTGPMGPHGSTEVYRGV